MENNKIEQIRGRVETQNLHISRIPKKTKEKFIAIANEDFAGDYGMLIKFLIDGLIEPDTQEIYAAISDINSRLEVIESRLDNPQPESQENSEKVIKTLGGKTIIKK